MMRRQGSINPCQARVQPRTARLRAATGDDTNTANDRVAAESLDIALPDLAATERLAAALAARAGAGDVVALWGGLGAGKTTFARAFIHARPGGSAVAEVPSPTFTLVQVYELGDVPVWHFDLYRLSNAEDAWELGIEEAFADGDLADRMARPARVRCCRRPASTSTSTPMATRTPAMPA